MRRSERLLEQKILDLMEHLGLGRDLNEVWKVRSELKNLTCRLREIEDEESSEFQEVESRRLLLTELMENINELYHTCDNEQKYDESEMEGCHPLSPPPSRPGESILDTEHKSQGNDTKAVKTPSRRRSSVKRWSFLIGFITGMIGIFLSALYLFTPNHVCIASTHQANLDWVKYSLASLKGDNDELRLPIISYLKVIDTESTGFSFFDRLMLAASCKLMVVESVSRFAGRNPLARYDITRHHLRDHRTALVLVNGTCSQMSRLLDAKHSLEMETECIYDRRRIFNAFLLSHVKYYSGDATAVDLEASEKSATRLLSIIMSTVAGDVEKSHDSNSWSKDFAFDERHHDDLKYLLSSSPGDVCSVSNAARDVKRFQFTVIGPEGVGKSTTLRWLAYHLQMPEYIKNRFLSATKGGSFTRHFIQENFSDTVAIADSMGIPKLDSSNKKWVDTVLCHIKDLFGGVGIENNGLLNWNECSRSPRLLPWAKRDKMNSHQDTAAQAILFILRNTRDPDSIAEIRRFIESLKKNMEFDLTLRMVFAVTNAADTESSDAEGDEFSFKSFAQKIFVSPSDIFPLNVPETLAYGTSDQPFVPASLYIPIIQRLMEKSCNAFDMKMDV